MSTMSSTMVWAAIALLTGLAGGLLLGRWWVRRRMLDDETVDELAALRRHLGRAQRMEALGVLSGSIMHNLNNLLSVVLGQARLARDELPRGTAAWNKLGQVLQAGEAAAELSREVDSYNRDDDHERRPTRLQPVVRSTVKLLRDILPETVDIVLELDDTCGPVLASPTQVQQMLMSLCSNAYHAMFRRRGRITVSMGTAALDSECEATPTPLAPGHYVTLSVVDNGRGMDTATLGRVFEPYFSARAPRRGAGLGLTMVARLLAANEGAATVSSLPGHGSRFELYFPIIARSLKSMPTTASAPQLRLVDAPPTTTRETHLEPYSAPSLVPVAGDTPPIGRPARVLLVEDDRMVASTVQACLERSEMQVTCCEDGATALSVFTRDPGAFDLLLTDQFLTGLDGREVVREVRRYRPHLPAIIMTGHPEGIQNGDVETLGLAATLIKPFVPSKLLNVVKAALGQAERQAEG